MKMEVTDIRDYIWQELEKRKIIANDFVITDCTLENYEVEFTISFFFDRDNYLKASAVLSEICRKLEKKETWFKWKVIFALETKPGFCIAQELFVPNR